MIETILNKIPSYVRNKKLAKQISDYYKVAYEGCLAPNRVEGYPKYSKSGKTQLITLKNTSLGRFSKHVMDYFKYSTIEDLATASLRYKSSALPLLENKYILLTELYELTELAKKSNTDISLTSFSSS